MFCREQAARFQSKLKAFELAGAKVIALGNGTAPMAREFVEQFGIGFEVYTDPTRKVYELAGMRRVFKLGFKTMRASLRAIKSGHRQGKTKGDAFQQGGILAFDAEGAVIFEHIDAGAGLHADVETVLSAVQAA